MITPTRPITPDDMVSFTRLADVQISPDGELVAFVAGEHFKVDTAAPKSQIWVVSAVSGVARPFTNGTGTDDTPRWSPDGRTLAFLSDRHENGKPQIYLLDRVGGEARKLSDLACAPSELAWSPDGTHIAFLMADPLSDQQRQGAPQDDAIEVEKYHQWQRVWTIDVARGVTQQVTNGAAQIWEFSWAPDGGFVLLVGAEPYEWSWFTAQLARVGPAGGVPELVYYTPEKQFASPRIAPDGTQLAFLSCTWSDRGINGGDVFLMPADGSEVPRNITPGYNGSIWWIQWLADGNGLDYIAYEAGATVIGRIDVASGTRVTRWRGNVGLIESATAHYIARDTGTIAILREDALHPQDVWLSEAQPMLTTAEITDVRDVALGEWRQLTHLHPQIGEFALGETRVLYWQSTDGMLIQGQLILPVGYHDGQRVPLITWVHGGPAWLYPHSFYGAGRDHEQMLAGAGYAVLLANPRGSAGWGVNFIESNLGDFGGNDFADILAGIDHVVALGIADPDRLGIGGWSYGGFMTAWAVTQTTRFKAAIMGAGICNWRSFHGVASISTWDQISLRANPYEQGGAYDRFSPIHYVQNVQTPTLILHGAEDIIVPVSQGYEFFRALKDHGIETELVVYPREPHGLTELAHNVDRFRRYLAWFQRYLG